MSSDVDLKFHKYHGTGNDFVILDGRSGIADLGTDLIVRLCDRRFGIGADGLIILHTVLGYDFGMTYFNSDGRESTMCGNGGRCVVAFADFLSLIKGDAVFLAADGPHYGRLLTREGNNYLVSLRMKDVDTITRWHGDLVIDTGSPHLLRFVDNIAVEDIVGLARPVRYHQDFEPSGINVNFIKEETDHITVRTYERGVEDETLSCGTGVTAAALAFASVHHLESGPLQIQTPGGDLLVRFIKRTDGGFTDIWLEGPAVRVFEGIIRI